MTPPCGADQIRVGSAPNDAQLRIDLPRVEWPLVGHRR